MSAEKTIKDTWDIVHIIIPIITFILGFVIKTFIMSKKDRVENKMRLTQYSATLAKDLDERYSNFQKALIDYTEVKKPTINNFYEISTTGESYFGYLKIICDAILSKNIDSKSVKNTHLQNIKDAAERTLPLFYETLIEISKKNKYTFNGKLKKENYLSILKVLEKYLDNDEYNKILKRW